MLCHLGICLYLLFSFSCRFSSTTALCQEMGAFSFSLQIIAAVVSSDEFNLIIHSVDWMSSQVLATYLFLQVLS